MRWNDISRQGLATMAVLVALLWTCFFAERALTNLAQRELMQAMRQMHHLKIKRPAGYPQPVVQPASSPAPVLSTTPISNG